jgi:ribosomal-protein-alanine N-acetyltransferase
MPDQNDASSELGESPPIIRPARLDDLDQIYQIESISFRDAYPLSLLQQLLRDRDSHSLVIEFRERITGFAFAIMRPKNIGHIVSVAVHPERRKRNYGTLLVTKLIELLKSHGATLLVLEVRISNQIAQKLYKKFNFVIKDTKRHYYTDGEDAYYMVCELNE